MEEAVITLPQPLAPGASMAVTALYSGTIPQSAQRLLRIGAPAEDAASADWDAIATDNTALRGYGNVLWYPVSAAPVFLGDGAKLFQSVGRTKLRESVATVRLRLAIEYLGDPPDAAFFCGHREQLIARRRPSLPASPQPASILNRSASAHSISSSRAMPLTKPERPPTQRSSPQSPITTMRFPHTLLPPTWSSRF